MIYRRLLGVLAMTMLLAGCSRVTGLPEVPSSVTADEAGLADLPRLAEEAALLGKPAGRMIAADAKNGASTVESGARGDGASESDPIGKARIGLGLIEQDRREEGLRLISEAVEERPDDLVLGNAFRIAVYRLQRRALDESKARGERAPALPAFLTGEPLATLERAARRAPGRAVRLQIAFSHVDRMVMNPALEIKAPASIDSVRALTAILEKEPHYVPALVARGLNHLYRPRRLVWPEHPAPPPDAASRDLGLAAAIGRSVGGAPPRLRSILLTLLGDAHAHEGDVGVARSWWMLAREGADDASVQRAIASRMEWKDDEIVDRLEESFEDRMADLDEPVSDLAFLWGAGRGPL